MSLSWEYMTTSLPLIMKSFILAGKGMKYSCSNLDFYQSMMFPSTRRSIVICCGSNSLSSIWTYKRTISSLKTSIVQSLLINSLRESWNPRLGSANSPRIFILLPLFNDFKLKSWKEAGFILFRSYTINCCSSTKAIPIRFGKIMLKNRYYENYSSEKFKYGFIFYQQLIDIDFEYSFLKYPFFLLKYTILTPDSPLFV